MNKPEQTIEEILENWVNFQSEHREKLDFLEPKEYDRKFNDAFEATHKAIEQLIIEARIDELHRACDVASEPLKNGRAMAESRNDGSMAYGVEESYLRVRIKELEAGADAVSTQNKGAANRYGRE